MSSLVFPLAAIGAVVKSREPYATVRVEEAASGKETRSSWWATPRYRYKVGFDVLNSATTLDFQKLASFRARHFGQLDSFLLTDPEDNSATDCGFGVGDGATTAFQLQRSLLGSVYDKYGGPWLSSSKPRANSAPRSEEFDNATWAKGNATVTANCTYAPDGSGNADKLVEDTTNGQHDLTEVLQVMAGLAYTWSVFARAGERTTLNIGRGDTGFAVSASFDLSAGTAVAQGGGVAAITALPNGWYRCELRFTAAATVSSSFVLRISTNGITGSAYTGNGYSGLYLWGAQAEQAASATQYIATGAGSATTNPSYWPAYSDGFEPVYDLSGAPLIYLDGDWQGRRQLYPWARTNNLIRSEQLDNGAWGTTHVTNLADQTAAPDGNVTAEKIGEDNTNNTHFTFQNYSVAASGQLWCFSVYLKASERTLADVEISGGAFPSNPRARVDVANGVVTTFDQTAIAAGVQAIGSNSWYRFWVIARATSTGSTGFKIGLKDGSGNVTYTGTTNFGMFAWGAQLEVVNDLSGPTSYLVTIAAAVTRTDYTLGSTGIVTPWAAPASGLVLSWTGQYFRRARLLNPNLSFDRIVKQMWSSELELVSVK